MRKYLEFIKYHKEIFSFALFVVTTLAILTITLILVRTNQDVRSRAATAPCSLTNPIIIDLTEQEFIEILNNHRQTLGAGPLRISENLTKLAQWQAEDMIENNYFNHIDSLGRNYEQRAQDCGINSGTISENLANGASSATAAFSAWQASTQGHKETMENPIFSQTGIARVASGGQVRWAQTFGTGNDGTTPDLEDPSTPVPEVKDCGSQTITLPNSNPNYPNLQCMIDNAASCTAAKLIVDLSIDLSPLIDMAVNSKGSYDFYNNSNNKCALNIKIDQQNVTRFPGGITEEEKENIRREGKKLENTQGTCVFNQYSDLVTFLTKIKNGEYSSSSDPDSESNMFRNAVCTGSYFDIINPSPTGPQNPTPTTHQIAPTIPPANPRKINVNFRLPGIGPNISLGENPNHQPKKQTICILIRDSLRNALSLIQKCIPAEFDAKIYQFSTSVEIDESLLLPNNFIVIDIPRGNSHDIIIKSLIQNNPLAIPTLLFRLGDFNDDDLYDLNDYIDLISCIKKTTKCTNDSGEFYDINFDGKVDAVDLNILLRAIRDFNQ